MTNQNNSWTAILTSPDFLGYSLHVWSAYSITMTAGAFGGVKWAWVAGLAILTFALPKEFWFDAKYEVPPQPFLSNLADLLTYMVGAAIAIAMIYWKSRTNA